MISNRRPFSINVEDRKRKIIDIVMKFARDNSELGDKFVVDSWWKDEDNGKEARNFKMMCPACGKTESYRYTDYAFIDNDINKDIEEDTYYSWAYGMLSGHVKQQIRLNGCKKHMQLILDIFGNKDGMEILEMFAKKNIIVAKLISDFIISKTQICDAHGGLGE